MLYEMIGIVRPGNLAEIKEITLSLGQIILRSDGVVRSLVNWGVIDLPRPISRHQMVHRSGHHFLMRYDASPQVHQTLRANLAREPRIVHHTHAKLGNDKLERLAQFGEAEWRAMVDGGQLVEATGSPRAAMWEQQGLSMSTGQLGRRGGGT